MPDASGAPGGRPSGDFAALVGAHGVWLLEYVEESGGLRVVQSWNHPGPYATPDEAFAALRRLLDARDSRRARLAIAVNGFGALHHTVLLPGASAEVLEPLVRREVMRSFDLQNPVIRFTEGEPVERRSKRRTESDSGLRMVFIAAIPRETSAAMQLHLDGRAVQVQCVTVVAESLRHIYASLGASREATAVLVCLAGGPYLAFFLNGHPEIVIDPPEGMDGEGAADPELLQHQVERGEIYFRQRFGGAEPTRLLLAAPSSDDGSLAMLLHDSMGIPVEPLVGRGDSTPEAIVAMGAAFAGRVAGSIDLFEREPTAAQRLRSATRTFGAPTLAMGAVAIVAALWLLMQLVGLQRANAARDSLQKGLNAAVASASPAQSMAQERATHATQAAALRTIYGGRARLAGALASMARVATDPLRFDSLEVRQGAKGGWSVSLVGAVMGTPGSSAVRTLNDFYAALRTQPSISLATLERFDYAGSSTAPGARPDSTFRGRGVALTFVVSFHIDALSEAEQ